MADLNTQPIIPNDLSGQIARELKLKRDSQKNIRQNRQLANLQNRLKDFEKAAKNIPATTKPNESPSQAQQAPDEESDQENFSQQLTAPLRNQGKNRPASRSNGKNRSSQLAGMMGQARNQAARPSLQAQKNNVETPTTTPAKTAPGQRPPQQTDNLEADTLQKTPPPEQAEQEKAEEEENESPYQPFSRDEETLPPAGGKEAGTDSAPPYQPVQQEETKSRGEKEPQASKKAEEEKLSQKLESEEEQQEAGRNLSREQRLAAIAEKKEQEEGGGEQKEEGKAEAEIKSLAGTAGQLTTAKWLAFCWLNVYYVLPLLYINFHFLGRYVANSNWFCEFGEEINIKKQASSKITEGITGSATPENPAEKTLDQGAKWLEIIGLFALDIIAALFIYAITYAIYYILETSWLAKLLF